jgi:hypothetical protein
MNFLLFNLNTIVYYGNYAVEEQWCRKAGPCKEG